MKKLIFTFSLLSFIIIYSQAQENQIEKNSEDDNKTIKIELKEGADPIIYINGKQYDKEIINIIDKEKIESIKIIKTDSVMSVDHSPGVIIIKTKTDGNKERIKINSDDIDYEYEYDFDYEYEYEYDIKTDEEYISNKPVVIINGIIVKPDSLKKISKDDIINIQIHKDGESLKKYKTKKGVIIVTTKKRKKKKKK